jgi:hypothetical protein
VPSDDPNLEERWHWADEEWEHRQWNVQGTVVTHHDSHGLYYEVLHPDGTTASYDPTELDVVK